MTKAIISFFSAITIAACTSNEIGNSKDVNPDAVYFDYEIWSEEEKPEVTINLQYRMGGPNGTTLVLNEPSSVTFDGEPLKVDSAKFSGAFYEVQKPLEGFSGMHNIVFTDLNGKIYNEEFEFKPFKLVAALPETIQRGDLILNIEGLNAEDILHVSLTDTSFTSEDINNTDTLRNGRLVITEKELQKLTNGPVHLQLYKEQNKALKNAATEGGRLMISYGLKRNFELKPASK